jgi:hypothetical protein
VAEELDRSLGAAAQATLADLDTARALVRDTIVE